MRNLVTESWLRNRDTDGLLADSSDLSDVIERVSFYIIDQVGHDFGDSTSAQYLDGINQPTLYLAGICEYPARSISAAYIDDAEVPLTLLIARPNRNIDTLVDKIRLKSGTWMCNTVKLDGVFGWSDTPDDVKEAVYRLIVLEVTGSQYGRRISSGSAVMGIRQIKRVKNPEGIEVEYQGGENQTAIDAALTSGDDYVDRILTRYDWHDSDGGVV